MDKERLARTKVCQATLATANVINTRDNMKVGGEAPQIERPPPA
jgi:hypothetical protein